MFEEIEKRRANAGISQQALCAHASVHPTTYTAIKSGRRGGNARTLKRLSEALDVLIAERAVA